jgi:hypothetical protein
VAILYQIRNAPDGSSPPKIPDQVGLTAGKCTHYAMCKIDYLNTNLCRPGRLYKYVAYWPQGRMEIVSALSKGTLPVTKGLLHIADSCEPCGICDRQCNYYTGMRINDVMVGLKDYVARHLALGREVVEPEVDAVVSELRAVVGEAWATNDPAILVSYSRDSGLMPRRVPRYVAMPASTAEVAELVRVANRHKIAFTPRASGANAQGLALGDGLIIDLHRMDSLEVSPEGWSATIGPGVTAFQLQKAAVEHGLRACVAEPAAAICSNILFSRVNTLFNHAYGSGGDLIVDAEFVDSQGNVSNLDSSDSANLFSLHGDPDKTPYFLSAKSRRICTRMTVKLFPTSSDEECLFVPFDDLRAAFEFTKELGARRLGIGVGVVSAEYIAFLLSLTREKAAELREVLEQKLRIGYFAVVLGDQHVKQAVEKMTANVVDQEFAELLQTAGSKLLHDEGLALISELPSNRPPYEALLRKDMQPLLEMTLDPSVEDLVAGVDPDLRANYLRLFNRPHMRNFVWLNNFRINSARISREAKYYPVIFWASMRDTQAIVSLCATLDRIAAELSLRSGFGYSSTLDFAKWVLIEYDFYFTNDEEQARVQEAYRRASVEIATLQEQGKLTAVASSKAVFRGQCRTESLMAEATRFSRRQESV